MSNSLNQWINNIYDIRNKKINELINYSIYEWLDWNDSHVCISNSCAYDSSNE